MALPIYQIDAFTTEVFKGNPAAVCPLEKWPEDEVLQSIAAENNLAETAFFVNREGGFELRWFTPVVEVALCGHATLASAHVLFDHLKYPKSIINFYTMQSGILQVSRSEDRLIMDFPTDEISEVSPPPELLKALGVREARCFKGKTDFLIILKDQMAVDQVSPDFRYLSTIEARGIIVSAPGEHYDFVSRFFGPAVGIDEDPVTGSAHTTLTPYWAKRLNKNNLTAQQRSKRTGEIVCELKNDRVLLSGNAKTYLTGEINLN
ncbi:MAG: PhzF family phenazine biosynthesis protein [Bacteroidota bacterium]